MRVVRDEEGAQPLALDLRLHEGARRLGLGEQLPHGQLVDALERRAPLAVDEALHGGHHAVADVLGRPVEDLPLEVVEQPAEGLADRGGAPLGVEGVVREVGQLEQHRRDQVHRLDELEVDVHVVRHQPPPLRLVLLGRALAKARRREALSEELLEARARSDLHQG